MNPGKKSPDKKSIEKWSLRKKVPGKMIPGGKNPRKKDPHKKSPEKWYLRNVKVNVPVAERVSVAAQHLNYSNFLRNLRSMAQI